MATAMPIPQSRLQQIIAKWRAALTDAATGPLVVAAEVVKLAEDWPAYQEEAGGATATQWLRSTLGKGQGLPWFARRHEAVKKLGEACRRTWHHEAAVWAAENVGDDVSLRRLKDAVHDAYVANGRNPLTEPQVRGVAAKVLGRAKRGRVCKGCAEARARVALLEETLRKAGLAVPSE
jgi:hypothetical protein